MDTKTNCLCSNRSDIRCDDVWCDLAGPGEPGNPNQCRICWLRLKKIHNLIRSRLPCSHLGEATGEMLSCSTCPSSVRIKVYNCNLHSRCVLGTTIPSTQGCVNCPDHQEPSQIPNAGDVRNLLFHLYPVRSNPIWCWHVEMLRKYIHLFNGKKVLALALDSLTENPSTVKSGLSPIFDEIIEVTNDPSLREVLTFEPLFSKVHSVNPNEATLYAHGKGVGRYAHPWVLRWTELLYELNIDVDSWKEIQKLLINHPICGSFKKVGRGWPDNESLADWHYSGSWFWFRNRDLFMQPDWRRIDRFWSGIESYPGLHFKPEHAACLFYENSVPGMNLYNENTWKNQIEPSYTLFREQRVNKATISSNSPSGPTSNIQDNVIDGLKVELGGGDKPYGKGFIDIDRKSALKCDLEQDRLPFDNDTVAEVYSSHCLEHIRNLHHILQEIVRICKVGARVTIIVPHYLSSMAMCHDHKQVISPEQVDHWTNSALDYWWNGCSKRLEHIKTTQIPSSHLSEAKKLFPHLTEEQLMRFIPNTAHEIKYELSVVHYESQ